MRIQVERTELERIIPLRAAYRREAGCQIVRDSILPRGLADPYLILADGGVAGYGGVWNEHFPNRVMELYLLPEGRAVAGRLFRELLAVSGATHVEAQTNLPLLHSMLLDHAVDVVEENVLFEEGWPTELACPGALFRPRRAGDEGPEGAWVVERQGQVVAAGGILDHYNPPYGDLYMEVVPAARRQGLGSFLVQELRQVCREAGMKPAARCDAGHHASRRTLERGGLRVCGRLLAGVVGR